MSILTESVQIENNFHFKAKIFDIGFEPLPFTDETFDFDIFERREGETVEIKKQEAKNEIAAKPLSIDDLLVPSGMAGLAALAADSYYGNKKTIPIKNRILDYIFVPIVSRLNASNDNYQITIFHKPIELIVPYSGYSIARLGSGYLVAQDYEIEDMGESFHYSEIKPVNYMQIPRLYNTLFSGREALPYTKLADDNYNIFESSLPEIKFIDGISIADNYLLHVAYTSMEETYETRIKPINYAENFTKAITENTIQVSITNIPIQAKTYHTKMPTTDYSPRLLEEVVEESAEICHKSALYHGNQSYIFFNLPKPQNDNERKNPDKDISDIVVQAFEYSQNQQEEAKPKENHQNQNTEGKNNYSEKKPESAKGNALAIPKGNSASAYREPRRYRRNNHGWEPRVITNLKYVPKSRIKNQLGNYGGNIKKSEQSKALIQNVPKQSEPDLKEYIFDVPAPQRLPELKKIPFEKDVFDALESFSYQHRLETCARDFSVVVYHTKTGRYYNSNGNLLMPTPSINKLALAATVAYYVQHEKLDWDQYVTIQKELIIQNDRLYFKEGQKIKLWDMVDLMLRRSVDTIFDHVVSALGYGDIDVGLQRNNKFMEDLGFSSIKINDIHKEGSNYNSNVADGDTLMRLMHFIKEGGVLNPEYSERIIGSMEREEWSPFFRGRKVARKVTSKPDGMAILGSMDEYIFFVGKDNFRGESLSEWAYDSQGNRYINQVTKRGVVEINSLDRHMKSFDKIFRRNYATK